MAAGTALLALGAPTLAPPLTLVYNHMPKCAGTSLTDLINDAVPHSRIEDEFDSLTWSDNSAFVLGSVREPCDYYVSLWAYGGAHSARCP